MDIDISQQSYQTRVVELTKQHMLSFMMGIVVTLCTIIAMGWYVFNETQSNSINTIADVHTTIPSPTIQPTPTPIIHVVQPGEDICTIATQYYGTCDQSSLIINANTISNPEQIEINQQFVIPTHIPQGTSIQESPKETGEISAITSGKVETNATTYTIQAGDTLFIIAEKMYGDGNAWPIIATANNMRSSEKIEVGQQLTIPR